MFDGFRATTDACGYGSLAFAGTTMLENRRHTSTFPRRDFARVVHVRSAPKRAWAMPGAQCTRSLVWVKITTRVSHHRSTGKSPGIPARDGLRLISCPPRSSGSLVSVARGIASADLAPASRRQDHTTLPSAANALVRSIFRVHRIPPRVNDDGQRPFVGRDDARYRIDFILKSRIFVQEGLDRANHVDPAQEISFCAQIRRAARGMPAVRIDGLACSARGGTCDAGSATRVRSIECHRICTGGKVWCGS
jgi:hypothetical protein